MLSRVADALFWMSRYLERAEQTSRLLDVCFHLELDLHGVAAGPHEFLWTGLLAILQQIVPPNQNALSPQRAISQWLTFDLANPNSVMSCVARARNNARAVRGTINSEMWKQLNKLYWQLCDEDFARHAKESPYEFYQAVECGHQLFQGVCDATLTHDEGWQFIRLGRYLERADRTLRILDIEFHLLQEVMDSNDWPLVNLQWAGVLRGCRAFEAYQRLYVGRVETERVIEFLLLHPDFPRSVRFSLQQAAEALARIEGESPSRPFAKPARVLGQVLNDLVFCELDRVLDGDLHGFLSKALERCTQVSRAVQNQYSLH